LTESYYTADNLTRGTTLASRTRIAGTSAERRRGLLATESLKAGDALWIAPCEAIHTLGMRWPIDAIFMDKSYRVRKLTRGLLPWRIAVCWTAESVLELPAGVLLQTGTRVGDRLAFHLNSH
jgi:uncharacterized membrane protein (UPF0127 family)